MREAKALYIEEDLETVAFSFVFHDTSDLPK